MKLSVVVPVHNEEANIEPLHAELTAALERLDLLYELIFVDDGSRDGSLERLHAVCERDARVEVLRFPRNYGQTAAIQAGIAHAAGDIVVTMDGDLQNDPADIGRLLARMDEGYDIVAGWRRDRKDSLLTRRLPSLVANWLVRRLVGGGVHDNGCALRAYRREIVERTRLYSDMHRFMVPMLTLSGGRISELVVNHRPRRAGRSKYGLSRTWKVALDLVTLKMLLRFSSHPAVWFALLAFPFAAVAVVTGITSLYLYTIPSEYPIVPVAICLITMFATVNLVLFGMLAELVVRLGDFKESEPLLLKIEARG